MMGHRVRLLWQTYSVGRYEAAPQGRRVEGVARAREARARAVRRGSGGAMVAVCGTDGRVGWGRGGMGMGMGDGGGRVLWLAGQERPAPRLSGQYGSVSRKDGCRASVGHGRRGRMGWANQGRRAPRIGTLRRATGK